MITYEDRPGSVVGVKLLALSVARHCPGTEMIFYHPPTLPPLEDWAREHGLLLRDEIHISDTRGWNTKPDVLLRALEHARRVVWLDSDIVLCGDLLAWMDRQAPETFFYAQDAARLTRVEPRCAFFDLPVVREPAGTINSGVLGLARHQTHLDLLHHWRTLISSAPYLRLVELEQARRPAHMVSDQDVLGAAFASLPGPADLFQQGMLRAGREHITAIRPEAYGIRERLRAAAGLGSPLVLHGQGCAPWQASAWKGHLTRARWQLNPYTAAARAYRAHLPGETLAWLDQHPPFVRLCRRVFANNPHLQGIPLVLASRLYRMWLKIRHRFPTP